MFLPKGIASIPGSNRTIQLNPNKY